MGIANFKIAAIALWPVGRRVVSVETARAAREANARRRFLVTERNTDMISPPATPLHLEQRLAL